MNPDARPSHVKCDRLFALLICGLTTFAIARLEVNAASVFTEKDTAAIQRYLKKEFGAGNKAIVVGLLDENGTQIFAEGKLDNGTDGPVNGDTIFEIGSITKVFTSLLALDSDRRGEISLQKPVSAYLPAKIRVPEFKGTPIAIAHLAGQDSGLPWNPDNVVDRPFEDMPLKELKRACDAYTKDALYASISRYALTNQPGTQFQYSNVGMALLGLALERRIGQTYESLVVERICRPLGMNDTLITLSDKQRKRLASGHYANGERAENINFKVMAPAGSLLSTVNDLLKLIAANLDYRETNLKPLLKRAQEIRHTGSKQFGRTRMPWQDQGVYQEPGSDLMGHGGGGFGYLAFVGFDRAKRRGVAILSGQMNLNPAGIGWAILQNMPLTRDNIVRLVREIVGLGVALRTDEETGLLQIRSVYPRSPAGVAGLRAEQFIHTIDGESTRGKTIAQCLNLLRGEEGQPIRIEVGRADGGDKREIKITRGKFITTSE